MHRIQDARIYFHMPEQFLDLSGKMSHKIFLGQIIQSQITYTDNYQLSRELSDGSLTCSLHDYDNCIYRMLEREMVANTVDNCTVPWVPNNSRICTKPNDVNTTFWIAWNRLTNQKKVG